MVVWLDAEDDVLFERATRRGNRPLLDTDDPRTSLTRISSERNALYELACDLRIDTTQRNHEEVADLILQEIESVKIKAL